MRHAPGPASGSAPAPGSAPDRAPLADPAGAAEPGEPDDLDDPGAHLDTHSSDDGPDASRRAAARDGRLVRRWVPAQLQSARWEPGRPGALMLSLVAALAAVIAAVGVWRDRPVPEPAPSLPLIAAHEQPERSTRPSAPATQLVISVVGRVARPGLVRLADGARVADALDAAGGAPPGTDLLGLNLARKLSDGEQLLVGVAPPPGQPADGGVQSAPGGPVAGTTGGAGGGVGSAVDLNAATMEQLDALPGVGPVTAQRILDWRAAHGRFTSVDQLREVSGIGESKYAQLKDLVRV
jgi:competence protein ComEA